MRSLMVDTETLAVSPDSKIIALGAVEWDNDAESFAILREFETVISISGQDYAHMEEKTLSWWMTKTTQEAREAAFSGNKVPVRYALQSFYHWVTGTDFLDLTSKPKYPALDEVWSKGADFDIAILKFHFAYHEVEVPWSYKAQRCFRQLTVDWPEVRPTVTKEHVAHRAIQDARDQAEWCHRITQYKKTVKKFADNWAKRTVVP